MFHYIEIFDLLIQILQKFLLIIYFQYHLSGNELQQTQAFQHSNHREGPAGGHPSRCRGAGPLPLARGRQRAGDEGVGGRAEPGDI